MKDASISKVELIEASLKSRILNNYFKFLTFFTIGSFAGCIYETVLNFFQHGKWTSRQGLIYGPFSPVYGIGILLAVLLLEKSRKNNKKLKIFIFGTLLSGIAEYLCSWIQETVFHTISWNYSKYPLDINGRTTILLMFAWGIGIFLFMQFIYPLIMKLIKKFNQKSKLWLSIIISIFFAFDIAISSYACHRQYERHKKIPATTEIQKFFDKHYDDKLLKKIYPNKKFRD